MSIAPNGVSVANYDPLGVGSPLLCLVIMGQLSANGVTTPLAPGAELPGAVLKPGFMRTRGDGVVTVADHGDRLPGTWKVLGALDKIAGDDGNSLILAMRIA